MFGKLSCTNFCFLGSGLYYVDIRLPDVVGVYTLSLSVDSLVHNVLNLEQKVVVRPIPYDKYPRFLECAYPYYFSAFSMMFGVFLLSFAFLYHREPKETKKNK